MSASAKSEIAIHPAAAVFPMLPEDELQSLADDIGRYGLLSPIALHEGLILDGRNRQAACQLAGIEPDYFQWSGEDPIAYVVSCNLQRRQMTASQRAMSALSMLPLLEAQARDRQGTRGDIAAIVPQSDGRARDHAAALFHVGGHYVSDAKMLSDARPDLAAEVLAGPLTIPEALRTMKRDANELDREAIQRQRSEHPTGRYQTIVIDPPWPMQKIERDERPNQVGFQYPTMDEEALRVFELPDFAEGDCHLYLWVTHKFMPMGLRLCEHWGFRYQCLLTWVKNVGFTPFSFMYSTEHVIFARKGSLPLRELGRRLDFTAKVREHSRKPDEFYDLVRDVSPGPRIDVFSREKRDGFDQYGKEVELF